MFGLLVPLVLGTALGLGRARSLAGLQSARLTWWPLALASMGIELLVYNPPVDRQPWAATWGPPIWIACLLGMLIVLVRNGLSRRPGRTACWLAVLGVAANVLVISLNSGYMPQSPIARATVGGPPLIVEAAAPRLRNVAPSGPQTRLAWLGDVIAQPNWLPRANVVSLGDVALALALGWWGFRTARSAPAGHLTCRTDVL